MHFLYSLVETEKNRYNLLYQYMASVLCIYGCLEYAIYAMCCYGNFNGSCLLIIIQCYRLT